MVSLTSKRSAASKAIRTQERPQSQFDCCWQCWTLRQVTEGIPSRSRTLYTLPSNSSRMSLNFILSDRFRQSFKRLTHTQNFGTLTIFIAFNVTWSFVDRLWEMQRVLLNVIVPWAQLLISIVTQALFSLRCWLRLLESYSETLNFF